jgi:Cu(I)/Ag(I) efflux system membrane fusion protein
MKNILNGIFIVIVLISGIMIGRYSMHSHFPEKKPLYWIDSMEPTIHYNRPGKSRMGMELVPVYPENQSEKQSGITISPEVINNLGVRTTLVTKGKITRNIDAVGYIEPNENKINHIHAYTEGWVKKLFVNTVGASVKKNQLLLQIYSPLLVNAQEEYLIAENSDDQDLKQASIKKLQALHLSPQQIQKLIQSKKADQLVDVLSPQEGVLTGLNIREGMHITPDIEMISLVDLSSVWMIAEIYAEQANKIKPNEPAEARLSAYPDKVWKGTVEYIYPQVDPMTRTLKIRLHFNNPDGILKPNMYANVSLLGELNSNVISIPIEALIRSSQGDRVVVALGNGRFSVRKVNTGSVFDDSIEILSGLKPGERIVTSGQFMLDSEANLKANLERLEPPKNGEE